MSIRIARSLALAITFCAAGQAQTFGDINGIVTDSTDAVIAGAEVTVTNSQTNLARQGTTNADGNYTFPSLPPGIYNIRAEKTGFRTELRSAVELQVQQSARIDFRPVSTPGSTISAAPGRR